MSAEFQFRFYIYLSLFVLMACNSSAKRDISTLSNKIDINDAITIDKIISDDTVTSNVNKGCNANDIFELKISKAQLDSIFQNLENMLSTDSIFGGVKKTNLVDFFQSIDEKTFLSQLEYSKQYEFDMYPSKFRSDIGCPDNISLMFLEDDCSYRLEFSNSFYVEDFGCSDHSFFCYFRVADGEIIITGFDGAG